MKVVLLIGIFIFSRSIRAQEGERPPFEYEWQSYFSAKKNKLLEQLYNFALEGKIKAYKDDWLTDTFTIEELKNRGGQEVHEKTELGNDTLVFVPFDVNELLDFRFCKSIVSSPFEDTEINQLKALGLTYNPIYSGVKTNRHKTFCWFSPTELKRILSESDFEWIQLIYHYVKNDNAIIDHDSSWYDDVFADINRVAVAKNWLDADSTLYARIGSSLVHSSFYIEELLSNTKDSIYKQKVIFDQQRKKYISYEDFHYDYAIRMRYKGELIQNILQVDTLIVIHREIYGIQGLQLNEKNGAIQAFYFEFKEGQDSNKLIKLSIDADVLRKRNYVPTLFWFFEDYYRWKE